MQISRVDTAGGFVGKAGLIGIFGVFAASKAMAVRSLVASWGHTAGTDKYFELAAHVAAFAFVLLVLGTTLMRFRPRQTAEGWEPRFSALIGTFLSLSLVAFPPANLGSVWRVVSIVLVLSGWV